MSGTLVKKNNCVHNDSHYCKINASDSKLLGFIPLPYLCNFTFGDIHKCKSSKPMVRPKGTPVGIPNASRRDYKIEVVNKYIKDNTNTKLLLIITFIIGSFIYQI